MATSAIAATVATQGGSTFQMNMFSIVKTAFEVAVMRLVSMPGHAVGEIARRMPGQMAEQIAAQVAGHADEGEAGDPAGDPPQQIVGGDQRHQQRECDPDAVIAPGRARQRVNQIFTPYCVPVEQATAASTRAEDHGVGDRPPPHIATE